MRHSIKNRIQLSIRSFSLYRFFKQKCLAIVVPFLVFVSWRIISRCTKFLNYVDYYVGSYVVVYVDNIDMQYFAILYFLQLM